VLRFARLLILAAVFTTALPADETLPPIVPTLDPPPTLPTEEAVAEDEEVPTPPETTEQPPEEVHTPLPHLQGSLAYLPPSEHKLFSPGIDIGHVGNNAKNPHRRLVQRTIMPTEQTPTCGAVLTFDDQLIPFTRGESSAVDVAKALQKRNTRAIFFANVPGVSKNDVNRILKKHKTTESRRKACQELLDSKRKLFIETIRSLLRLTNTPPPPLENSEFATPPPEKYYTCEVYNHTAFHHDIKMLKAGSDRLSLCLMGITFIEDCLDEAYQAERPGWKRARWFRFPFLHAPKKSAVKKEVVAHFNKLGLLSLGETQDSKDVLNMSWKKAYDSLQAAKKNKRYNPKFGGTYSQTDQPIALFHTRTWYKVGKGILKAIPPPPETTGNSPASDRN